MDLDVGGLMKQCRKKAKLSQEAFAELMHTTQSTISRIEKNLIACEVSFLQKAARLTNSEDVVIAGLFSVDAIVQVAMQIQITFIGGLFNWML